MFQTHISYWWNVT